jgi:hypothetical protein
MKTKKIPFTIEDWRSGGKPWTEQWGYVDQFTVFFTTSEIIIEGIIKIGDECRLQRWNKNGRYSRDASPRDIKLEVMEKLNQKSIQPGRT